MMCRTQGAEYRSCVEGVRYAERNAEDVTRWAERAAAEGSYQTELVSDEEARIASVARSMHANKASIRMQFLT